MARFFLILILLLFISFSTFSQETKLKTIKFKGSKEVFERYTVLKLNKEIKHGPYVAYFKFSNFNYSFPDEPDYLVRLKGNYVQGKKDGEWVEYSRPFEIKTKGNYQSGKKVSVWETVKEDGQVIITERYDYENNKKLNPHFRANVSYPELAVKAGLEGEVIIGYKINKDCSVQDIKVIKSLSPECDQEVINLVKKVEQLSIKYKMDCEEKSEQYTIPFKIY